MNRIPGPRPGIRARRMAAVAGLACLLLSVAAASALAAPEWRIKSTHGPQNFAPGGAGEYVIEMTNNGDTITDGTTITVTDQLPPGVLATAASGPGWNCLGVGTDIVTCDRADLLEPATNPDPNFLRGAVPVIRIAVAIDPGASGTADNAVRIEGGGASGPADDVDPTPFSTTPAGFGIVPSSLVADGFDGSAIGAAPVRQAGAHPFEMRFNFDFNQTFTTNQLGTYSEPDEHVRTIRVKLPRGFVGNPEATPKCSAEELVATRTPVSGSCPIASQVGVVDLILQDGAEIASSDLPSSVDIPVYNMTPPNGSVAAFAFMLIGRPIWILASLDPTDYSVVATISHSNEAFFVRSAEMTLWGVPADTAHDGLRMDPNAGFTGEYGASVGDEKPLPFLTLPSVCGVPSTTNIAMDSWQRTGSFVSYDSTPVILDGCDEQRFAASMTIKPTTSQANAPSGLMVDMEIPQDLVARSLGTPPLKDVSVTLPEGMRISPSAADGLTSCTPLQIGLGTNDDPTCPDASRVGTISIDTPLLPDPLAGRIYLAAQNDNPFGSTLAIYLVAQGQGATVKLAGHVRPDPATGQLTTTFDDNPMLPFSNLHLEFRSGPRAPLVTPPICGVKTSTATLESWNFSLPAVQASDTFTIDGNCGRGFDPGFTAGTANPTAGRSSPLVTRFTRSDSDEELSSVDVSLPQGLLGRVADVDLCADGPANAGTCGEGSRIGRTTVGAGPGVNPFFITDGRVYMTGPYKGAPFGLSIVVHAKAGPIDLGTVVVRAAVHVDKHTAALRVASDPLPTILQGVPLQVRVVDVTVDRPGFALNPTNCSPLEARATLGSTGGRTSTKQSRFQVGDCANLPFRPKMAIGVGGRGRTRRGRTTPLQATVSMTPGQANLRSVRVTLPKTINARLPVIEDACTRAEFEAGRCDEAKAGTAVAVTPLLRDPLKGEVFFVRNGNPLPDMFVALRGQVDFDLIGRVSIPGSVRLATNFATVPDVPITKFTLSLVSGRRGPVGNAANLCTTRSRRARASISFTAQNGKVVTKSQRLGVAGCRKARAAKSKGGTRGR